MAAKLQQYVPNAVILKPIETTAEKMKDGKIRLTFRDQRINSVSEILSAFGVKSGIKVSGNKITVVVPENSIPLHAITQ